MISGADSMGPWGHVPPRLQMAGHGGGTVSRRTANKKLYKLYWPSRKRSSKRLIVLLEPKSGGARQNNLSVALRRIGAPHFRSGPVLPPLSDSFRRHCAWPLTNQTLNIVVALTLLLKQHAVVSIELNIAICPAYPEKFVLDNVVAPLLQFSIAIVPQPMSAVKVEWRLGRYRWLLQFELSYRPFIDQNCDR